jgi:hypothetical protein
LYETGRGQATIKHIRGASSRHSESFRCA